MKHVLPVLFLLFLFVFLFPKPVFAVTLTTTNSPSSIDINQEFTVDVDLVCTGCGASYLRGVFFYPEPSTSYSGYTQNNAGEWINSSSSQATSYFKINEGSWSGQIKFKFDSTKPTGEYFFKVGRYTANNGSLFSSSPASIAVTSTTPSLTATQNPTPTQTPTSTPTPTATPTSSESTYKINSVKDSDGTIISNIKIYVDSNYTHHYAPETITFCSGCHCDDSKNILCEPGVHTIKLVKENYADWSEQKTFNLGDNFEVNPILSKITAENTPTPTPTTTTIPTKTPTPKTSTPTPKVSSPPTITITSPPESTFSQVLSFSTDSAQIEPTIEVIKPKASLSDKNLFLIGISVFSLSGGLLYFRLKNL